MSTALLYETFHGIIQHKHLLVPFSKSRTHKSNNSTNVQVGKPKNWCMWITGLMVRCSSQEQNNPRATASLKIPPEDGDDSRKLSLWNGILCTACKLLYRSESTSVGSHLQHLCLRGFANLVSLGSFLEFVNYLLSWGNALW